MHVRRIVAAVAASGLVAAPAFAASPARPAAASSPARTCAAEVYQWSGTTTIAPGASFATGVTVPVQPGTDLVVTGSSSDALDSQGFARSLSVTIGGASAALGATVPGGEIVLRHDAGAAPLTASGASVTVNRCTAVAQEAPVRPAASSESGRQSRAQLPDTGASTAPLVALGAVLAAAGLATVAGGRWARRSADRRV